MDNNKRQELELRRAKLQAKLSARRDLDKVLQCFDRAVFKGVK